MRVQVRVTHVSAPLVDALRALSARDLAPAAARTTPARADDAVGRELVDEQQRRELREQGHALVERLDVVQDARGDHRVPRLPAQRLRRVLELARTKRSPTGACGSTPSVS